MSSLGRTGSTLPPRLDNNVKADTVLPPLPVVRADAEKWRRLGAGSFTEDEFKNHRSWLENMVQGWNASQAGTNSTSELSSKPDIPDAVVAYCAWWTEVPNLFQFCIFVHPSDLPDGITDEYVWVQRTMIRMYDESTPETRLECHFTRELETAEDSLLRTMHYRKNLIQCLMSPDTERYEEGFEQLTHYMGEQVEVLKWTYVPYVNAPWRHLPSLYAEYGAARVFTNRLDQETKTVLQNVLDAVGDPTTFDTSQLEWTTISARINMVLVLHVLGQEPEKERQLTEQAVTYIRRHPHLKDRLVRYLRRPDLPPHPVLVALGEDWFEDRSLTAREERRRYRKCAHCDLGEPVKTLSKCTGCQIVMYCSRDCQRAAWRGHRDICRKNMETRDSARNMIDQGLMSSTTLNNLTALSSWLSSSYYPNTEALIHALRLQQDLNRASAYIIFRLVSYVDNLRPRSDPRDHFRVDQLGVFKITDILEDVQHHERLESQEAARRSLDEHPRGLRKGKVYVLTYTFVVTGNVIGTYKCRAIGFSEDTVRRTPYDPAWREKVNRVGRPPQPFPSQSGAQDAEFDDQDPVARLASYLNAANIA
ncbi:hypothetical protein EIP91_009500 [Steccherinum ochraceum]|uniref:MYND-type domain-containing protein n=1 Tax=Steccherinum ochraceum TaxID=92696 RepID=A0A4R0R1K4_9APHY|nr:hypothetical protein EIP91_009500 [Steccherinum ochraceum]